MCAPSLVCVADSAKPDVSAHCHSRCATTGDCVTDPNGTVDFCMPIFKICSNVHVALFRILVHESRVVNCITIELAILKVTM